MLLTFLHIIPSLFSAPEDLSVSDDMEKGKINSIKIEGVKGEGDYDLSGNKSDNKSDNKWDSSKSTAAGSYTVSFAGDEGKVEGNNRALTGVANDNKVLMMIPQELGGGAKVTINFTPTGKSAVDLTFDLKDTKWVAGNHVTYLLSTTKIITLNMGSVTYPQWQTVEGSAFTSEKLKDSYANDDALGMYVVDKNNKVIEENLKFTYKDGKWTVESGKEFKGSPQYNYFVYYPYQKVVLPGAPAKGTEATEENVASADNFFAKAIDTWKSNNIAADQSTLENMNACDLQIGKASLDEDGCSVSFKMEHAMGLAVLNRESKSLDHFYKLQGYEDYTWSNGSVPTTANGTISSGQKLFSTTATQSIIVVAPNSTVTFTNTSTGKDEWKYKSVSITINKGNKVYSGEAKLKLQHYDETTYTMKPGDIYYDNGGITKPSKAEIAAARKNGLTTIGIIGYLGKDYWTEKDVVISGKPVGGHALVMCLKTIGSTGSTVDAQEEYEKNRNNNGEKVKAYIGTRYVWYSSNIDAGRTKVKNKDLLVKSYNETYGSGYAETDTLIQKWGSAAAAAYQAKNYKTLPANSTKCTGWFLPSAGQYYAVIKTLGAPFTDDWTGIWDDNISTHPDEAFFSNMTTGTKNITKNINDKLEKVGDSNYTEFFGSINTWAWCSSEFSDTHAVYIDSGVDENKGPGSVRFYYGNLGDGFKTGPVPVRPFLAF